MLDGRGKKWYSKRYLWKGAYLSCAFLRCLTRDPLALRGNTGRQTKPNLHRYPGCPSAPAGAGFGIRQAVSGVFFLSGLCWKPCKIKKEVPTNGR